MELGDTPESLRGQLDALTARCAALQARVTQMDKINLALMDRVEREMDAQGNAFSMFQSAIALESQVKERTLALEQALQRLEQTNRELHASNEAAQAASRAKSAFLASMSHELRTPMNGVVGMTDVLLAGTLDQKQRDSLNTIKRSALSLLTLINDVLDFSKIEAGQMRLESTPFNLRNTTDDALLLLRPQIAAKGLELLIDWPTGMPCDVLGDPVRYAQIITNLVGNALKFTPHGHIRIAARIADESPPHLTYRFEVQDTGIGIRAEVIPRLFNSFTQADSSTTRQFGGTGLGLAIVRRLCQSMEGDCGVNSEYGSGTTFWFTLKLERQLLVDTPSLAPPPATVTARPDAVTLRVLLVEDNTINQEVALAMLEMLGCTCVVADNGQIALDILQHDPDFDLVLMDCQMPVMDGFETSRRIRSSEAEGGRHADRHMTIIALTANAMAGDREACLAAGMDDFMSKPFQLTELAALLDKWRPRTQRNELFEQVT